MSASSRSSEPDFDPAVLLGMIGAVLALFVLLFLAVQWPVFVWSLVHLRPMLLGPVDAIGGGLDVLFSSHPLRACPDAWRGMEGLPPLASAIVLDLTGAAMLFVSAVAAGVRLERWKGRSRLGLRSWDPRARLRRRAFALPRDLLHLQPRQRLLDLLRGGDVAALVREVRTRVLRMLAGEHRHPEPMGGDSWPTGFAYGRELRSGPEAHMLVVGASGSGKTFRVAARAVVEHAGPLVVVSTKLDLYQFARLPGELMGRQVSIFAPTFNLDPDRHDLAKWSPLAGCAVWEYAQHMGRWLYEASPNLGKREAAAEFYEQEAAEVLIPALLQAAALGAKRMANVYRWVVGDGVLSLDEAAEILQAHGAQEALELVRGIQTMPDKQRGFTLRAARQLLAAYQYTSICEHEADEFDVQAFIRSNKTLYIGVPEGRSEQLSPVIGAMLGAILRACEQRAATVKDTRTLPLVKIICDEAAHLTPLRKLPTYLAVSRSYGVRWMVIYQTIGQIKERYHGEAQAITSNTLCKQFLGPIHDQATREEIAGLLGGEHITSVTHNRDRLGYGGGKSERSEYRPKVGAEDLALLPAGTSLVVHGNDLPFIAEVPIFDTVRIEIF